MNDKTNWEKRFERLENRVGKLTSRTKMLETELKKTNTSLETATKELEEVRVSYFKNLAHAIHGTEPPPAIEAPSSGQPTQPQAAHPKP